MRTAILSLAFLCACVSPGPIDRETLARDLEDAVAVAAPLLGESGTEYVGAVQGIAQAIREGEGAQLSLAEGFAAVRNLEGLARAALIESGKEPGEVDAILAATQIMLRRLERSLWPAPSAEMTAPTSRPTGSSPPI